MATLIISVNLLVATTGSSLEGPGPELFSSALGFVQPFVQSSVAREVTLEGDSGYHSQIADLAQDAPLSLPEIPGWVGSDQALPASFGPTQNVLGHWRKALLQISSPLGSASSCFRIQGTRVRIPFSTCPTSLQNVAQE